MYKNIYYSNKTNKLHIWDDKNGHFSVDYKKYAYIKSNNGKFTALDGTKVNKIYKWERSDEEQGIMYESDIRPEVRYLIDNYYQTDDVSEGIITMFLDIEVAKEGKHSTPWQAANTVTSIAFYDAVVKRYTVCILDIHNRLSPKSTDEYDLEVFHTEKDLLMAFLNHYRSIQPDIVTHWNGDQYDMPYLYNRMKKILGENFANLLSPVGEVKLQKHKNRLHFGGVSNLDYMYLYKALTYNEEPSYALEAISQKELGKGKIKYEGSLDDFLRDDPDGFIEYNLNDVKLIVELDQKLLFLDLARNICHKGHVPYEDVYSSVRFLDGACLTYLKRLDVIAPNKYKIVDEEEEFDDLDKSDEDDDDGFEGAYVKDPVPGLYEWVFDEDLKALYPSCQRSLNMSPETKICRIENWDLNEWLNENSIYTFKFKHKSWKGSKELRNFLEEKNYSISAIGVIYNLNNKGLVPSILETWDSERESYRALAKKHGESGNNKLYRFYDSRQLTMKILSNSLYGVLGNTAFRFYDLDGAESTTVSGQCVVKHKMMTANNWFNEKLQTNKVDYVIYCDTDSTFLSALPLIQFMEKKINRKLTYDECVEFTFKTSVTVEEYVNSTFSKFAKQYFNVDIHYFKTKQEYVSETAFWIKKKRYAQKIISEKGTPISKIYGKPYKLDVKGLDVVRSSFPKAFRGFMSEILTDILNKVDNQTITDKIYKLKDNLENIPIYDIMTNSSVKEISKYNCKNIGTIFKSRPKGMPIHVKSAANYNDLLVYYNLQSYPAIVDGDKIKWGYLKPNNFGIETLGLTGYDDPIELVNFMKQYIDYKKIFEASLLNKLNSFYAARGWGEVPGNNLVQSFFEF